MTSSTGACCKFCRKQHVVNTVSNGIYKTEKYEIIHVFVFRHPSHSNVTDQNTHYFFGFHLDHLYRKLVRFNKSFYIFYVRDNGIERWKTWSLISLLGSLNLTCIFYCNRAFSKNKSLAYVPTVHWVQQVTYHYQRKFYTCALCSTHYCTVYSHVYILEDVSVFLYFVSSAVNI